MIDTEKLEYMKLSYEQYFQYYEMSQRVLEYAKIGDDIKQAFLDLLFRCDVSTILKGQDKEVLQSKLLLIKQIKKLPLSIQISEKRFREACKNIEQSKSKDHSEQMMEPYARYKYEQKDKAREIDANISLCKMEQNER